MEDLLRCQISSLVKYRQKQNSYKSNTTRFTKWLENQHVNLSRFTNCVLIILNYGSHDSDVFIRV